MINLENISELVGLEMHRAAIAINQGRTVLAAKHLAKVDELNVLWDTMVTKTVVI